MPSTATTNVTISTILDLIGPTPSSIGSDDGQSAFDSVLNSSPPLSASSCQPTQSPKRADDQRLAPTDSRRDDSRPPQSASSDTSNDSSSEASQSKRPNKTTETESPVTRDDQDDPEHPEEKSADVQQLIAQSLAAIPAVTLIATLPTANAVTEEATTSTEELPAAQAKSKAAQAISRAAQTQANDPQAVSPITEVAAATTEEQPSQPVSPALAVAKHSTTDESAKSADDSKLATPEKAEAADKPTQSPDITFESTLDNDKSSHSSRQESSAEKQPQSDNLDPTAVASPAPDVRTSTNSTATPLVAPVATAPTASDQSATAKTTDQNQTGAITAPGPRSRLPAQALAPATAANNRRPAVEVDSARLLTRVVRAFSAAQERDGEVHIRLSPPELGALRLDIRVDNGALTAHLQTETEAARTAIIENLPALRERLAEQGVRIERFDVDLMQRQSGGMPDQSGGRQPETTETTPRFVQPARASNSSAPQPSLVSPTTSANGGLNVIV